VIAYVDFESMPIRRRPAYPPEPVGVSIKLGAKPSKYYAFAHPRGGNTHTKAQAVASLRAVWKSGADVGFHHAKFDHAVAVEKLGLPPLSADRVHDTLLALFLRDARAKTFELKPNAEALLGEPPEERDEVLSWLVKNQPVPGVKLSLSKSAKKSKKPGSHTEYAGAYIAYAPVPLVARYARGDTDRTAGLDTLLQKHLRATKMLEAYDRERLLLEPIAAMERDGVPVDLPRLRADVAKYEKALVAVDAWLTRVTKAPPGTNWDASATLTAALVKAGMADEDLLGRTKKSGKVASNKEALARGVTDKRVGPMLKYRSRLCVSLRTFMRPWLDVAEKSGGTIFTTWNTTRTDDTGARTGRLSSTPNFQNLTKRPVKLWGDAKPPAWWAKLGLPELPEVRGYLIALPGHVLVGRDWSQQELRLLAHYACGVLLEKYQSDPWFDVHGLVKENTERMLGHEVAREIIKRLVFMTIYGGGRPAQARLAQEYGIAPATMIKIAESVKKAVPGLADLIKRIRERTNAGEPIRTWGGRLYHVEAPKLIDGRWRTFEYRMTNLLIQGSAADMAKEALLRLWAWMKKHKKVGIWRILLSVHDEFLLSVPEADEDLAHATLTKCMASVECDVAMYSEGKSGKTWGSGMHKYDEKGIRCQ
jgi:DNA polymerase I-like protein with 3'-5' exonuclease and polymerase domains